MYKKILVPLDGSALAEHVLPHAVLLAKATGAEVTFITVLTPDRSFGGMSKELENIPEAVTERRQALRGEARLYLEKVAHEFADRGVPAHCAVRDGDAAGEIIACAEADGADLIAMATHGRSGIDRLIMGSVAERVLRGTRRPLFLIRALPGLPPDENLARAAPPP